MGRLNGRVALISGGGRGLGEAMCLRLAQEGSAVAVTDKDEAEADRVARGIAASGGRAIALRLDVTQETEWRTAIAETVRRFGGIDVLVNNAGVVLSKLTEETTLEEWRWISAVNVEGVFLGIKTAIPAMRERAKTTPAGGSIVNISSISGIVGSERGAAYSTSKGGVRLMTKSTALEFARLGYRVRVNSVHPGLVETDMGTGLMRRAVDLGMAKDYAERKTQVLQRYPMGRLPTREDIANAVLFLASDESAYMTGAELVIDGGLTAV
jgi:NAD(P)-dependent dehydrogenase (short-subunit alcohol dehydrogenase family)